MCLLTVVLPGADVRADYWAEAAYRNPDGFGWALELPGGILRHRGLDYDPVAASFREARAAHPDAVGLFHWRWATGGGITAGNCHPFTWAHDDRLAVAHNGVLPVPATRRRSDTRVWAEDHLAQLHPAELDDPRTFARLERWAAGSKVVVLSAHPATESRFYILNESAGHWAEGVWYSNTSYRPAPPSRFSFGTSVASLLTCHKWCRADCGWCGTGIGPDDPDAAADLDALDVWPADPGDLDPAAEVMGCAVCGTDYLVPIDDPAAYCPDCGACWCCDSDSDACACWPSTVGGT